MTYFYIVLGTLLGIAAMMALIRDLLDRKAGHRSRRMGPFDPTEARLGGPHVNLNPNLPRSDRDR